MRLHTLVSRGIAPTGGVAFMSSQISIGVIDLAMGGWMAGAVVSRTMALSLQAAGAKVVFVTKNPQAAPAGLEILKPTEPFYFPGEWTLRKAFGEPVKNTLAQSACAAGIEVLFPVVEPLQRTRIKTIGWIPDFQHLHLSDLYTKEQTKALDQRFRLLSERSDAMLFSSEDSRNDFSRCFPSQSAKARVASFPSLFAFEPPGLLSSSVVATYHLPEKFLLMVNQFWKHKNHSVVPRALAILRKRGLKVPVVMAGLPADYRDKQNNSLSETFQAAAIGGVWDQCMILGKIPREDLTALLRQAAAVVQPSRFEGWNTTVEDAKALGCPLIVSDLAVHREQCPDALGFFPAEDAGMLAELIAAHWESLSPRSDAKHESSALSRELVFASSYGRQLMSICQSLF